MRPSILVAIAAAVLLLPALGRPQTGDAGPDAGMIAQNQAAAGRAAPAKIEPPPARRRGRPRRRRLPSAGGEDKSADARADKARCRKLTDADIATAPIAEVRQVTHHQATIGGKPLAYTATAGTLTLRDNEGKPTASMFYVAYTTATSAGR